jgi:hypothetical protein
MKKWQRVVAVSICLGVLATVISGIPSKSGATTITTSPDYCIGPDVIGYKCPDVTAKAKGVRRGFPFSFRYEEITIQKQDGFLEPKALDNGTARFDARNFVLCILVWSLVAGAVTTTLVELKSKAHK